MQQAITWGRDDQDSKHTGAHQGYNESKIFSMAVLQVVFKQLNNGLSQPIWFLQMFII